MPSKIKPRLSRGVLDMKFMQRTKAKVAKEDDDEQSRALYSNELNEKMLKSLIDGRLSFRGMNPELERLLELEQAEKEAKTKPEQPKEITDQEMADTYYANQEPAEVKSYHKKFTARNDFNKRKSNGNQQFQKKAQFKRPRQDDDDEA